MRILILLCVFISSLNVLAEESYLEPRVHFNPVVSMSARTLPQWKVGFQKTGGANINSQFVANALSVGLLSRLEVGVVPIFYLTVPGSSNYTAKVNVYRGETTDWALSFTETRFKSKVTENGKVIEEPDLILTSFQLGLNYRLSGSDFTFSPFVTNVCGRIDSSNGLILVYSLKCEAEWGLDVQYQIKDREWLTFAWGHLREAGLSPYEKMSTGLGMAWSQFRPKEIFSRPSIGVYYTPDTKNTLYLVSTTFYEL
ncbi:hypothetical protein [Bdellovibrio sp. HCB-162]|uniref:hypothetical protein n=1 Tax=Bdellovibrio sp. HCB-162 TaxID=3394234 RepID=UPI0039BD05C8